jgi:response regulator of citrate/malate metabolism
LTGVTVSVIVGTAATVIELIDPAADTRDVPTAALFTVYATIVFSWLNDLENFSTREVAYDCTASRNHVRSYWAILVMQSNPV